MLPTVDLPDANCNTLAPIDLNSWFSDIEITALFQHIVNRKGYGFINPLVCSILALPNAPEYKLSAETFECDVLLCPLNIEQMHWIIVVFEKIQSRTFLLDPLQRGFRTSTTVKLAKNLHLSLNKNLHCGNQFLYMPPVKTSFQKMEMIVDLLFVFMQNSFATTSHFLPRMLISPNCIFWLTI